MLPITLTNLSLIAAILLCLRLFYHIIYHAFVSPLSRYPGPFLSKFTRIPFTIYSLCGTPHAALLRWHQRYGPVVRIGSAEVSYVSPEVWRDAWANRPGHEEFPKARWDVPPNGVRSILTTGRLEHSRYRRLLSHAFSAQGLAAQEPLIQRYVDLYLTQLTKQSSNQSTQDMVSWFNWTTFDLIGDLAFGEPFGCLERCETHQWIADIFGNLNFGVWAVQLRSLGLLSLLPFVTPKHLAEARKRNYQFAADKIERRLEQNKPDADRGDFWDEVLKKPQDPEKGGMSRKEMESNASVMVLAGSETTATMLSGTTFNLLRNPGVLRRVSNEVRSAFASSNEITIDAVSHLPYLLAVLNESLRMYPPVPVVAGRIVPSGGDTIDGHYLPGGTVIQASQYAACNVDYNFAKPHEFHPERWLEDRPEEFKNDNHTTYQPFTFGPRNCIGQNLAYAEMRLILAKTLYNFDLSIPQGVPEWDTWQSGQRTLPLWEKTPLLVDVKPRKTT